MSETEDVPVRAELLRPADVEAEWSISESTLATWRARGVGPAWQPVGPRRIAYRRSAVEAWLAVEAERVSDRRAS